MQTIKTETGTEPSKGLVRQNMTRAATMLVMILMTLTAAIAQTYTVTFNANGGTGTMEPQTFTAGTEQRLKPCTFSRQGSGELNIITFRNWNTAADGSGTEYDDQQSIAITSDITLYAIWSYGIMAVSAEEAPIDRDTNKPTTPTTVSALEGSWGGSLETDAPKISVTAEPGCIQVITSAYSPDISGNVSNSYYTGGVASTSYITIADGASLELANAVARVISLDSRPTIACEGNATIVLRGENVVSGGQNAPAIYVPEGKTLTIRGSGSLTVSGGEKAAAIGGAEGQSCGNIIIESGTIKATGGRYAAAIGSGKNGSGGNVSIGNVSAVTAVAGENAQPIGSGENGTCGDITIDAGLIDETTGATRVLTQNFNYNIWVGATQVSALTRTDILGDGTASYDPYTQTLTLDHPNITTTSGDAAIRAEGIDLTVKGFYRMTEALGDYGLSVTGGTLTLAGDFTFRGLTSGVNTNNNPLDVKGTLRAYGSEPISCLGQPKPLQGFFGETRVEQNGALTHSAVGYATGDGTAEHPFEICNSTQWGKACEDVANGCATAGKHFLIVSSFSPTSAMGTADNPFAGTIDGQRQYFTLTAGISQSKHAACTALFPYVCGATITNLLVKGYIIGGAGSAGIVGKALSGTTTMDNCVFDGIVTAVNGQTAANWMVGAKAEGAAITTTNCLDASLNLWGDGSRAYSVSAGDGISIVQVGTTGMTYDGAIWATKGATVSFTASGGNGTYAPSCGGELGHDAGVYSLTVPEEDVAIMQANAVTYAITSPGDVTGGNVHTNKTVAPAGSPVCISVTLDDYYLLKSLTVKDADDNEIEYDEYGIFRMPAKAVTVSAELVKKYSFENGVLTLKYGTFNKLGNNAFGPDVTSAEVVKVTADKGVYFSDDCGALFFNFVNCTEMDLSNVETSYLESTRNMFGGCEKLKKLNLAGWNTAKVVDMSDMFYGCYALGEIDLSGFSFASATDLSGMFDACGVYMLTLPAGVGITKEMRLVKGSHDSSWNWSGWQKLGDPTQTSTFEQDASDPTFSYAVLPSQTETSTFVWKVMPDDFVLELPDGEDNRALVELWDGMTVNVKLTGRTLYHDGCWNTICLPFTLGSLEIHNAIGYGCEIRGLETLWSYNANGEAYYGPNVPKPEDYPYRTGFDNGTLHLYFSWSDEMYAGVPYIIKWDDGSDLVSPTFNNVTITKTLTDVTSADAAVSFCGTYDNRYYPVTDRSLLFVGAENKLYYPTAGARTGPERAYFQLLNGLTAADLPPSGVKMFTGNGTPTGTAHIETAASTGDWYDLNGRKLTTRPTQKGIYIKNGRKEVVK